MKNKLHSTKALLTLILFVTTSSIFGQLTGTKTIPGNYASVALAVTALNSSGVGAGGVTFNIAANYTETITATLSVTATGTSANPVIFQKDPSTSGSNPLITSYTAGAGTPSTATQDGIWRFLGSDYITIDGIDLKDNAANTTNPSTMEYGYALYKASTSNGCQNVTIKNCVITLNNINNATGTAPMADGSTGIIVMNALAASATTNVVPIAGGTNSNNKFYSNTIQNCNTGIAIIGYAAASPFTLADANNDIGGSASSTGNTIINYGGASGATNPAVAIRTLAQQGFNASYNSINNNNGSGTNHPNTLRGILINTATSANATITYNTITVKGGGSTQRITGIENASGSTAASNTIDISNNTITNSTYTTATTGGFYGIYNTATPATLTINNNTISDNSCAAVTTGYLYGILNTGAASAVTINSNTFSGNSTAALTTGLFAGIYNAANTSSLSINSNTLIGNSTTATSGVYYAIYNTGAVTTTININSNNIGNSTTDAITLSAANSGSQVFINNRGGAATAALSINNNNFQGVTYTTAGTGANTYIFNNAATLSQAINSNTFTSLNLNTTGSVTFISNSVIVSSTGTQNVNSNSIATSFTKAAGGTVTLFTSGAASLSGSVINNNNNNFSNITVSGATVIAGWVNTDAGASTKTIQNNTFTNWSGGSGAITAMSVNITSTGNATTGNAINNISGAGTVTGIATAAGNDKIYSNNIHTLSSTGVSAVTGISITAGTTKNVYGNKIYDLEASTSGGTINGILVSGGASAITSNIYNNLIGDLRTPATSATDPVRGISITSTTANSTINVYYNTIYLNAASAGVNFGTSGIYHTTSGIATTATLNLRNNIIANTSTSNGTGLTVAYRRSSATLTNYASTSDNNLFYAGIPGTSRLIFYDGTNSDQTLTTYKARVSTSDAASVTENITSKFLSNSGSSSSYLHLDPTIATQAESGAVNISGLTTDYDSQVRQGNIGYAGTGTAPDMGADEYDGIKALALSGTYTVGTGGDFTSITKAGGLFEAINNLGFSGNVTANVTSNLTEDGTNILNPWVEQGVGNYTLTIKPSASTARTITGNVAGPMIRLNGADRVTIDGSNGTSSKYFTFQNTNTGGTTATAFTFINGATNNSIKYSNIEAYTNATNGVIFFSTSTTLGGNSTNTISNCSINADGTATSGNVAIYSSGTNTAGYENSGNTISSNNIYNYRDRGLDITAVGSSAWTISGNSFYNGTVSGPINYTAGSTLHGIRILGGSGYSILNNYVGGNAALASGTSASYSSTLGNVSYQAILLNTTSASPASNIKGNTIASITMSTVPTAANSNAFIGIETNGFGINIGGSTSGEGNTIGSNTTNSSINVTTTTASTTYTSIIRGVNCNSNGGVVIGNKVGSIDVKNIGTGPAASALIGIYVNNASAPSQVNNNIIGSAGTGAASNSIRVLSSSTATTTGLLGIGIGGGVISTIEVDGNIIQNMSNLSSVNTVTGGGLRGISSAATGAAVVTITNNTISTNTVSNFTTGLFYGIYNSGAATSVSINSNTLVGNYTSSATGVYYAIFNGAAVTSAININSNNIGNSTTDAITFNAANSGAQIFIVNTAGTGAAALSISNNNFQKINYVVAGTGSNTFISNSAATLSQAINSNTFTGLNVKTSGNVTFISNNVVVSGSGTQNVNSNSISGSFTKNAGGTITLFTSTASSLSGSVINNNSNNFSNITVAGATTIAGWINTDAGASTKTIQNNTFSTWSGGTSAITALSVNITGAGNSINGNAINNITSAGAITGITSGAGNNNIYSNTINGLSTTGAAAVTGITATVGTTKNIYKNKIYDLQASNATGTVNGILVAASATGISSIYNNIIGDLRTPSANNAADVIRGISIISTATSTTNVYYNTIYLNATSSGTNFSTSGIYHVVSATSTISSLNLINNSITNISTPKGTGLTVAYRISGTALNNYAATSNNNLYYAGTPGANRLIFYNGTNSDQTIAAFKTRVSTRDTKSVTENLTFLSTTGSSSNFLHVSASVITLTESGGINISGFTDDFDGDIRAGNTGYTGLSSKPDIGADEFFGLENTPPVITYTLLTNTSATSNRNVTGVSITDASGVNITGGTNPRIYYKRTTDANTWVGNTSATNGWKYTEATNSSSPFTFTIDYSLLNGGSSVLANTIQYFIVAQDVAATPNIAINSGTFASLPSSVALTSAAFPLTGTINSYNVTFSGTITVGTGQTFTSLTKSDGLFAYINANGLSSNITAIITSDLAEDGVTALNEWTETGAGNYTLSIEPDAATVRTISGDVVGGLIRLDGADRVTFDGSYGGSGSYLTFTNTNASGTTGTAFTFINGATNNTVRYCKAEAYANATNGTVLFSTSAVSGGNSNNLVEYCDINSTVSGNSGKTAIYSAGTNTSGYENSANTISNNNIYDFTQHGLNITATGSSAWTISDNSFYNGSVTGSLNYPASSSLDGVQILGGSGYSVLNNYIGGSATQATGSNAVYSSTLGDVSYHGILLTTTSSSPNSNIKGNTIAGLTISSIPTAANANTFTGIETTGLGINIGGSSSGEGNTIGSNTSNGSIAVTTSTTSTANTSIIRGISSISTGGVIIGNQVGGFDIKNIGSSPAASLMQGIFVNAASAPSQVDNNIIGSTGSGAASNSIRVLSTSTALTTSINGIATGSSVASSVEFDNNTIESISNLSTTSSGSFTGINNATTNSAAIVTITNNDIQDISTASNANTNSTIYTGIYSASPSTISNNILDNITLAATGNAAQVRGIYVAGAYAHTISSNNLSNFSTASTKSNGIQTSDPSGFSLAGILNGASASGQIISGNTLSDFSATTTSSNSPAVNGIAVSGSGSGNIFDNRIAAFGNNATGTSTLPGISGIMAYNGSFNVYNNSIKIDNAASTNGIKIYGLNHAATGSWNYFHNSVSISGNATGTATRSSAFIRTVNGTVFLRNNVLVNTRTGTGTNYAISNIISPASSNWSSSASDYNDVYSSNLNTTAEWDVAVNKTFAQFQTASGGDANSVSKSVTFVASSYDLEPDANSNCSLDNTGTPITTPVVIDFDINTNLRSTTTPDLGAYEFDYAAFTPAAGSNSPVCNGSLVSLTADPGTAVNATYSWKDPNNVIVSTVQNPDVTAVAGTYTVTVTDENGCSNNATTIVSLTARPTGVISGPSYVCSGNSVTLSIAVTGTGVISGTLSSGDVFSGAAPVITVDVTPVSTTTYTISTLTDATCTSIAGDLSGSVTVNVTQAGQWLGTVSTNWNDAGNWCGGVPDITTDVTIFSGVTNYPVVSTASAAKDINITSGAFLSVTNATLEIAGAINNSGTFTASNGTIEMSGSSAQTIPSNAFANNTISNLIINNNVSLAGQDSITGTLSFAGNNRTLTTGGGLTLKSTIAGTARVADITNNGANSGNSISGNVIVERFITGRRSWQLLSSPLSSTNAPTINAAWQEGATTAASNPNPGYGTHITGGTSVNGFDQNATNTASIKQYNGSAWVGLANTNATAVTSQPGFIIFVRGSRANNLAAGTSAAADNTVLRSKGLLKTGTQSYTAAVDGFALRANPFASRIDFHTTTKGGIDDHYYLWDPALTGSNGAGGYVTLVYNGTNYSASPTPVSPIDMNGAIESGSAFFIDVATGNTLNILETDKVAGSATVNRPNSITSQLSTSLNAFNTDGTKSREDGILFLYNTNYSNAIDGSDARKIPNTAENLSIKKPSIILAIEKRQPVTSADTIQLNMTQMRVKSYQFEFNAQNLNSAGLTGFIQDSYTNTESVIDLTGTSTYNFTVINVPGSWNPDRFRIVFRPLNALPLTFNSVKAIQQDNKIQVEWKVENERNYKEYEVERSDDGKHFVAQQLITIAGNKEGNGTYQWPDKNPLKNISYYRIKVIAISGSVEYSNIVKVNMSGLKSNIELYPNPVINDVISLQLNNMPGGSYHVKLLNSLGQSIITKAIIHAGGSSREIIPIDKSIPKGIYHLEIIKPGKERITYKLIR